MFVLTGRLVDCAHQLFLTIVDRSQRQGVEGGFFGLTPEDVTLFFELPVAEGDDNMLKFKSF